MIPPSNSSMEKPISLNDLQAIYEDVKGWVKFAESKNMTLIGLLTFILTQFSKFATYLPSFILYFTLIALLLCLILNLYSYVPFTCVDHLNIQNLLRLFYSNSHKLIFQEKQLNLVFYMNIYFSKPVSSPKLISHNTSMSWEDYIRTHLENDANTVLINSYIKQIVVNSQITLFKLMLFQLSVYLLLITILFGVATYFISQLFI